MHRQNTTAQQQRAAMPPSVGPRPWRRVLVTRSCRLPQFQAALALVQEMSPGTESWVLTQPEFAGDARAAGAQHVIAHDARRLGPWSIGMRRLWRLRALQFDAVVIPIMGETLVGSENLLRLAAAIGAPATVIAPGGTYGTILGRRRVITRAVARTLRTPEPLILLSQMVRALLTRRSPPRQPRGRRLRVLHVINSLGLGGAQTQCAELVNRTPPDRYDVSVLVLADDGQFSRNRFSRPDVPVHVIRRSLAHDDTVIDAIADHCRRGAYDVVHTWLTLPNMCGTAAARLAGVPRIVMSIRSFNPGHFPQWCQWWFRPADMLASRIATRVTVNATSLAADHARWAWFPARRLAVVHNGLDPARLAAVGPDARARLRAELQLPADVPLVGSVGRLSEEKGHATFLRIVHATIARGLACHAVIVGDGPCEAGLRRLAAELRLDGAVSFLSARQDALAVIGGLDALVLASRREGFPNVVLEAGMLGVPVVCSAVGGVLDLVTDGDSRFPVGDVAAGAGALGRVFTMPDLARERAAALRRRCLEQFTAERMVADWLALYESTERPPARRRCMPNHAATWCTVAEGENR